MGRIFTVLCLIFYATVAIAQSEFTSDDIKTVQGKLAADGNEPGVVDGRFGKATAAAIRKYQADWT